MNAENRISPQAVEIEASILGAILLEKSALPKVIEIFSDPFVMYKPVHQLIYASILRLYEQNIPVDLITLTEELRGTGNLEKIGGEYYLTELTTKVSSAANIEYHAHIVLERALARQLIALSSNIVDRGYSETEDVFELIADATSMLNDVRNQTVKEHSISIKIVAKETNERVDKIHLGIDESLGFGFADIDYITGGMDKGNLVVYGGLEKRGKSILALQTMFYNAKKGIPCEFISTEMTRDDILLRYALAEEKLSWIKLKTRKFSTLELEKLKKRISSLGTLPIYVSDKVVNIMDVIAESERIISDKGIKLIVVDYIQRIIPVNKKSNESREREVASISTGLKNIAFKNRIPLIALSQLNDDLRARESRTIEQEMDKGLTINAPEKDEITADGNGLIIGIKIKQRFGAGGNFSDTKMIYDKCYGYWKSYIGRDDEPQRTEPAQGTF